MKRTAIKAPKQRKCALRSCRTKFEVTNPWHRLCSDACIREFARQQHEKALKRFQRTQERARLADKRKTRAALEAMKRIPKLKSEAQREFNAFVRERDYGLPCICCGRYSDSTALTGGAWDAGHYRSTGAADHLRFNEDNCHRQLSSCNQGRGGNYRFHLIERIGVERVQALDNDNTTHKWTRDELRAIRDKYRVKAREMRKARMRKAA